MPRQGRLLFRMTVRFWSEGFLVVTTAMMQLVWSDYFQMGGWILILIVDQVLAALSTN